MSHISHDPDKGPELTPTIMQAISSGFGRADVYIFGEGGRTVSFIAVAHFLPREGEIIITNDKRRVVVDSVEHRLETMGDVTFIVARLFCTLVKDPPLPGGVNL